MDFESINISLSEACSLNFFPGSHVEDSFISLDFGDEINTFIENIHIKISDHQNLIKNRGLLGDTLFIDKHGQKLTLRITDRTNKNLIVIPNLSFKNPDYVRFIKIYQKGRKVILILGNYVGGRHNTIRSKRGQPELSFNDCTIQ